MRWKLPVITLLVLMLAIPAGAIQTFRLKDSNMTTQLSCTSDTSGDITCAFTATGATLDLDDADLTTTGTISYSGSPTWTLNESQSLDPSSATVYWGMVDASNEEAHIYKIDSSHGVLYNDTAADGWAIMAGADIDDYHLFTVESNVPTYDTGGLADLYIQAGDGANVVYIRSSDLYVYNGDATANAVEDIMYLEKQTSGTAANGIGAGLIFKVEDGGGSEDQASIDVALTDVTDSGEEADIIFSQNSAGAIAETLRLVAANSGTTSDYLKYTANTTETDGILDVVSLTTSAVTGAAGMGVAIAFDYCDAGGAEEQGSIDHTLTTATNAAEDGAFVFMNQTAGAVAEIFRLQGASSATAGDYAQITVNTTETDAVLNALILTENTGTATHNNGLGISFQPEDAGGAEEGGSIDLVLTTATNGAEDAAFVFSQQTAGAVAETFRIQGASSGTTGDSITVTSNTTETNAVLDIVSLTTSAVVGAGGMGLGITFDYCDAGGAEEQGSIDNVLTTATNAAEDSDWVFSQQTAGAIAETLRLVAASSATTGDSLKFTSNTSETNGVIDIMTLTTSAVVGAGGNGIGISFEPCDAGGAEQQASIDVALTTATDTAEDADIIFSQNTAGAIAETLRLVAASSGTTGDYLQYTMNTTEDNAVVDAVILKQATGTGAAGNGLGIAFWPEDAGEAEEQLTIDAVLTTATDDAEDAALVIRQQTAGAIAETLRVQGASSATASDYLQFTANTTEDNGLTDVVILKTATGTATDGYGMSISFQPEDGTGSEEVASLDIVETTAARATNDTDFVFSQNINGTITETLRIDADAGLDLSFSGANFTMSNDEFIHNDTDDTVTIGSNDTNTTLQILGATGSTVIVEYSADAAEDNNDTWTTTVADEGALTVANEGTATWTFNERVNYGAGQTKADVVITDAAEYDVLAANSGKKHIITDLAQNTSIDLPTEEDGLYYEFWYCGGADEAHDHTIDTENNTNFFIGGVSFADTDAGAGADEINAGIYSDGNSNSKLTINNASAGTIVKVTCDGTNWYVSGRVYSDTAPAFADQ